MFWKNRFFAAEAPESYSGQGISIAILDTGISPVADFTEPKNRIAAFLDLVGGKTEPYDDNGHGTQLTGIKKHFAWRNAPPAAVSLATNYPAAAVRSHGVFLLYGK